MSSALSRRSSSTADSLQDLYKAYSPNYVLSRSLTSSVASGRLLGRSEVIPTSTTSSLSTRDRDAGTGYSASSVKLNLSNGKRVVAVVTPAEDDDDDEEAPGGPTSSSILLQEISNESNVDAKGEDSNNSSSDESVDDDRDLAVPSPSPGSRRRLTPSVAGVSYSVSVASLLRASRFQHFHTSTLFFHMAFYKGAGPTYVSISKSNPSIDCNNYILIVWVRKGYLY